MIGRNVTRFCDIVYVPGNRLVFPPLNGRNDSIAMIYVDLHNHLPLSHFVSETTRSAPLDILAAHTATVACDQYDINRTWTATKRIVDIVHAHACGNAKYSDICTLLQRNNLCNDQVQQYLSRMIAKCVGFKAAYLPPPNRKVSIVRMNNRFNDLVCVDHFFLDRIRIFHCMDTFPRYSTRFFGGGCVARSCKSWHGSNMDE